jgi:hypothetical protein
MEPKSIRLNRKLSQVIKNLKAAGYTKEWCIEKFGTKIVNKSWNQEINLTQLQ